MSKLIVSFSGGETSAYMTHWLVNRGGAKELGFNDVAVIFANTGQEREETLEFINQCDKRFNFNTHWIEVDVNPTLGGRSESTKVDFLTADRKGKVFEDVIKKYGLPNRAYPHCSRMLKAQPIEAYARSTLGWKGHSTAIGIRTDEIDRMSVATKQRRLIYPLISAHPMTKIAVNTWWNKQSFRLKLKQYQGNCKWCWKKSSRKLITLLREDKTLFDFPRRMEKEYSKVGPEFDPKRRRDGKKVDPEYRRVLFNSNKSFGDLERKSEEVGAAFVPADDEMQVFDPDLDFGSSCEESCEVYGDD